MEQLRGLIGVTAYCNFDPAFRRRQLQSNGFTSRRDAGSFQNRTRLVRRAVEVLQLYKRAKRTTRNSSFASKAKTARVREYREEGFESSPGAFETSTRSLGIALGDARGAELDGMVVKDVTAGRI